MRPLVRSQMEPETDILLRLGHAEAPVLGLVEARLRVVPELEDQIQDGPRDPALLATLRVKAAHLEVAGEPARAHAPVETASGHLVELGDALREHEGVVIRQTGHPGAELYRLRPGERVGDEQVGTRDVLPHRREVLADPRLLEPQAIERDKLLEVLLHRPGGVGAGRVQRHREVSQALHGVGTNSTPEVESPPESSRWSISWAGDASTSAGGAATARSSSRAIASPRSRAASASRRPSPSWSARGPWSGSRTRAATTRSPRSG